MMKVFVHILDLLLSFAALSHSLPLSTSSRWIVDDATGERVKFKCANWAAHMEVMLAEGLDKQPVDKISTNISSMGFNCVRLTWATHMHTRYSNLTVAESFVNAGLNDAIVGLAKYNPEFVNLTVVDAQKAVIEALAKSGVMTLLDCHVSRPQWCCRDNDGNGFFGDNYFDPNEWLDGLSIVAKRYKDQPMVVAMSLRNELRGPLQNATVWGQWMPRGANAINAANSNLLILVSGLNYDLDFTFLKQKPVNFNVLGKIVYEAHRYPWSTGIKGCENLIQEVENGAGFLSNEYPLFWSEFGINQQNTSYGEDLFIGCFMGYLADKDLDWSIWAVHGSYYLRDGLHGSSETFGMLSPNWTSLTNPSFHVKLQLIQQKVQDPTSIGPNYYIIYHAWSSKCVKDDGTDVLAWDCLSFTKWNHMGDGTAIKLMGTDLCLSGVGDGLPVTLTSDCATKKSQWEFVSDAKMEIRNKEGLCLDLDLDYSSKVMTKKCLCLSPDGNSTICGDNSQTQWFKLITANVQ